MITDKDWETIGIVIGAAMLVIGAVVAVVLIYP